MEKEKEEREGKKKKSGIAGAKGFETGPRAATVGCSNGALPGSVPASVCCATRLRPGPNALRINELGSVQAAGKLNFNVTGFSTVTSSATGSVPGSRHPYPR